MRIRKKIKPSFKMRIQAVVLSAVLLCGAVGYGAIEPAEAAESDSPATVWYAPGTQKIRPDVPAETYACYRMDQLAVKTGRSEYESAQIIMTAGRDIASYDLTINDLTLVGDNSVKYSADNIEVFNQKYIEVTKVMEGSPVAEGSTEKSAPGLYPDALPPFEAAKELGENKVSSGSNQGIWVTFYAPKGQQAGEYTGTFILDMDGFKQEIPVSLKIWDIDFAENYTAKSCFLIDWTSFSYAELDSSQDMYDAYADALLSYRLEPCMLMNDFLASDPEDVAYYTKKAFELAQDSRCNTVFMPYEIDNGRGDTYLVKESTKNWIRSFVDISLNSYGTEQQLNMVEMTRTYFTFIDEPTLNPNLIPRVNQAMIDFEELRKEVKDEYLMQLKEEAGSLSEEEYAFRLEVINSIDKIQNVLTGPRDDRIEGVEIYCPQVDIYDSPDDRAKYANDSERWWYTAVGPRYPYPTYHIDDTNLLSARLLSWMQADYGVSGNLYWGTNIYNAYSAEEMLEDPYDTAMRYTGAGGSNGDGFLFYPGKRYGVYGPIGSVRLQAIRDGMEEYETLEGIRKLYQEIDNALSNGNNPTHTSVNFDDIYARMSENLYSNTSVYTTQAYFEEARELMANLAELASMGGAVSSIYVEDNNARIQLVLPDSLTVDCEAEVGAGEEKQPAAGYKLYTFSQALGDKANVFACKVSDGSKSVSLNLNLGGEIHSYGADGLVDAVSVGTRSMEQVTEADLRSANTLDEAMSSETEWLQLALPQADSQARQAMVISDQELLSQIGAGTQKMVIKIFNDRDATGSDEGKYVYRLQFKYANEDYYTEIRQDALKSGYNEITIGNLFGYAWEETGAITDIRLFFGETNAEAVSDLYLIGIDIYSE